jgi:hypothetical protein
MSISANFPRMSTTVTAWGVQTRLLEHDTLACR